MIHNNMNFFQKKCQQLNKSFSEPESVASCAQWSEGSLYASINISFLHLEPLLLPLTVKLPMQFYNIYNFYDSPSSCSHFMIQLVKFSYFSFAFHRLPSETYFRIIKYFGQSEKMCEEGGWCIKYQKWREHWAIKNGWDGGKLNEERRGEKFLECSNRWKEPRNQPWEMYKILPFRWCNSTHFFHHHTQTNWAILSEFESINC